MPAVDHLVYAVPDLDPGVAAVAELTGVEAHPGGSHPGAGTRNALLSFDDDAYFEIISVDPDQPAPVGPRPFGVDGRRPAHLASFAIHPGDGETIESISDAMATFGFDPGPVTSMSRRRPDGVEISWRLTRADRTPLGLAHPASDGLVPFVIDWGDTPTPALTAPRMGRLSELAVTHPDPAVVDLLTGLELELTAGTVTVAVGDRALMAVVELVDGRRIEIA